MPDEPLDAYHERVLAEVHKYQESDAFVPPPEAARPDERPDSTWSPIVLAVVCLVILLAALAVLVLLPTRFLPYLP